MDDLLCYNPTLEQHIQNVRKALAILHQEKPYIKASKCEFGRRELGFLGHRVSGEGVTDNLQRVAVMGDRPVPTSQCRPEPLHRTLQILPPFRGRLRGRRGAANSLLRCTHSLGLGLYGGAQFQTLEVVIYCDPGVAHLRFKLALRSRFSQRMRVRLRYRCHKAALSFTT
jgi:hypothetical protein